MAEQQGRYLARCLNDEAMAKDSGSVQLKPFRYKQLGAMASVGAFETLCRLRSRMESTLSE